MGDRLILKLWTEHIGWRENCILLFRFVFYLYLIFFFYLHRVLVEENYQQDDQPMGFLYK